MKILLDTHILLWAAADTLPSGAKRFFDDPAVALLFSPASIWEIVIKRALGRSDFDVDPALFYAGLLDAGYEELAISGQHTLLVSSLPLLHKDPFDRILVAQSAAERIPLLTSDDAVAAYPGSVIFVR